MLKRIINRIRREELPDECDILTEAFGFLDGYYFVGNDNKKEYFEYDIVILDGLIKFFTYYKKTEVIKMLTDRREEIENWIKGDAWNEE